MSLLDYPSSHAHIKMSSPDPFLIASSITINIQIISDTKYNLRNCIAPWPRGAHGSFVLQKSAVGTHLAKGAHGDGWLIGM